MFRAENKLITPFVGQPQHKNNSFSMEVLTWKYFRVNTFFVKWNTISWMVSCSRYIRDYCSCMREVRGLNPSIWNLCSIIILELSSIKVSNLVRSCSISNVFSICDKLVIHGNATSPGLKIFYFSTLVVLRFYASPSSVPWQLTLLQLQTKNMKIWMYCKHIYLSNITIIWTKLTFSKSWYLNSIIEWFYYRIVKNIHSIGCTKWSWNLSWKWSWNVYVKRYSSFLFSKKFTKNMKMFKYCIVDFA